MILLGALPIQIASTRQVCILNEAQGPMMQALVLELSTAMIIHKSMGGLLSQIHLKCKCLNQIDCV